MVDIVATTSMGDAWDAAVRSSGDRTFLVYLDANGARTEYTYRQFDQIVCQATWLFRTLDIDTGTVVAMQISNSPEFISVLLGLVKVGAIAVPIGMKTPAPELLGLYQTCRAEWAIVEDSEFATNLDLQTKQAVIPAGLLSVHGSGTRSFETLCANQPVTAPPPVKVASDDVAELLFTSGTTASAKAVIITHANLVYSGHYAIWQASLRSDDRVFTTMPACHSNFQLVALSGVIMSGSCLVVSHRYSARRFWADVRAERASVIQLTAMMVRTLLLQPANAGDSTHCVRETLYFMPLTDDEKQSFENRFAVRLLNSYGSTESICWVVTDPPQGERRWPSVGRAGLGYEVTIRDEAGRDLAPGQVGEFWIKGIPGRTLMAGYLNDSQATRAALNPDGWLRTLDTGYYDADGWFYFVDRAQNLIKRSGENISSTEVEAVLVSHPLICEAAVIGVPDPLRDQAVKAFIRLELGADLDRDQIIQFCREHLAAHKVPQYVEFVTDFPRTASMKIEKRSLNRQST